CREKQLQRVKSKYDPIGEFDQRESIVKDFKCRFLAFTLRKVSDDYDWLTLAFGTKIAQCMLGNGCARILSGGARSDRGHRSTPPLQHASSTAENLTSRYLEDGRRRDNG